MNNNKEFSEIKSEAEWSSEHTKPKDWQWTLHGLFLPLSVTLYYIGSTILKLSNLLMFDTHHLEISVKGKE